MSKHHRREEFMNNFSNFRQESSEDSRDEGREKFRNRDDKDDFMECRHFLHRIPSLFMST